MKVAAATPAWPARAGSVIVLVVAGLLVGCAGPPQAKPSGPEHLNLDHGDHAISAHFGYEVEGGFLSARRIVIYHVPDAQRRAPRELLGSFPVNDNAPTSDARGAVYAVSDDGTILLYQHHAFSAPDALEGKPEGVYEYTHGRGDRLIHGGNLAVSGSGPKRMDELAFTLMSADYLHISDSMIRTTDGEEYPSHAAGGTALHRAASLGDAAKLKRLRQSGADLEARDDRGFTPLHEAIWSGNAECVGLLLERGASVSAHIDAAELDWTPLDEAARFGLDNIIELLLAKGADINARNALGKTAVDYAVEYSQPGTVEYLAARGGKAAAGGGDTPGTEGVLVPSPYAGQALSWNWCPPKTDVNWENEFPQAGESLDHWTELVTVGCYRKVHDLGTPEAQLETLRSELVSRCPGSTLEIIPGDAGKILFETHVVNCPTRPEECRLTRVIDGAEDRFVVRYAVQGTTLPPERRAEWIEKLSAVILTHRPSAK